MRRPVGHPDDPAPARVSFPRGTWVVLALFGLFMGVTLGGQFLLIKQQRDLARQSRNIASTTQGLLDPFLDDARPLAERTRQRQPQVEAAARRADRLTRSATPLVQGLTPLVQGLNDVALPETTRKAGTVFDALLSGNLPRTLDALDRTTAAFNDRDRLGRALRSAITVLGAVRTTGLVQRAADATRVVDRLDRTQSRTLKILTTTQELQRQALAVTRETLAVAMRTEGHAANLDRKFGGEAPPLSSVIAP